MKKKKKIRIWRILAILSFILGICLFVSPKEEKEMNQNFQIQYTTNIENINEIENIVISQNIPIPEEIQEKMKKEAEEKRIAEEKAKEEEKKKQTKIATNKQVTSRGGKQVRETQNNGEWIAFNASAYCPCAKCCGKTNGITASGTKATAGRTVAMPKGYSFGTKIEIKGMGTYTVEDRGGAITGNKIDIFFNTHQEALNFGRKTVYLRVVK